MLKGLAACGCIVDMEKRDVKFTKELIDKAVKAVPDKFTLYSPSGKNDMVFPHPEGNFILVPILVHQITRILPEIPITPNQKKSKNGLNWPMHWRTLIILHCPVHQVNMCPDAVDVYTLEKALKYSAKHIWIQPYEADNVKYLIDMSAAAAGGLEELQKNRLSALSPVVYPV